MERSEKYHPSLFSKEQMHNNEQEAEIIIPQSTIYDTPIQTQNSPQTKHVVIFGFSGVTKKLIKEQIMLHGENVRLEEGKNYFKIWSEDTLLLDTLLSFNHKMENGEIIGAYRQNFGIVSDDDIYKKKRGIFDVIYEYLFGQ